MERNKKQLILGIIMALIVIIIAIVFVVFNVKKEEDTPKTDTPVIEPGSNFQDSYEVNGIVFSDIEYFYQYDQTYITFKITNNNDTAYSLGVYGIEAKDKDGNVLFTFTDIYEGELAPKETVDRELSTLGNFTSATDLKFIDYVEVAE